jgi:hypothetical protein
MVTSKEKAVDKKVWKEVLKRITNKITRADLKVMFELHSKHFKHKYQEPCTCNKEKLRLWISELNTYFKL